MMHNLKLITTEGSRHQTISKVLTSGTPIALQSTTVPRHDFSARAYKQSFGIEIYAVLSGLDGSVKRLQFQHDTQKLGLG
jgi:hypothetical protein